MRFILTVLLHLGQNIPKYEHRDEPTESSPFFTPNQHFSIPNDIPLLVFGHVAQLRPGKAVIEEVFHLVVFWQAEEVAVLHVHQVIRLKGQDQDEIKEMLTRL